MPRRVTGLSAEDSLMLSLPQHPDQHRPKRPVLLAVNQEFGEGAALRVRPEVSDPLDTLEVGEHEDAEEFGASGLGHRVEARL